MTQYIIIFTTCGKHSEATKLSNALVDTRLAACVQIVGPIESHYNWVGKRQSSEEWLCIIKTKKTLYKKAQRLIKSLHTYDLPEITYIKMSGSQAYLDWIGKETSH